MARERRSNRRTQFHRAVERLGYCCPFAYFVENETMNGAAAAAQLGVAESTVYDWKRSFRFGTINCQKDQSECRKVRASLYASGGTASREENRLRGMRYLLPVAESNDEVTPE